MVKNLRSVKKTQIHSLGWEDLLEKGMVTHSSILAWKIPWTEESGRLQSMGSKRVRHNLATEARHDTAVSNCTIQGHWSQSRCFTTITFIFQLLHCAKQELCTH